VGRWEPDIRVKLQEAALTLYLENGFDQTTAAQIAKLAGVTERTFFRHFADKREVLFDGSDALKELICSSVAEASLSKPPMDALLHSLVVVAEIFDNGRKDFVRKRYDVISANPELRERELAKLADYAIGIAKVLKERGMDELRAILAAEMTMTVLRVGMQQWVHGDEGETFATVICKLFTELRAVTEEA